MWSLSVAGGRGQPNPIFGGKYGNAVLRGTLHERCPNLPEWTDMACGISSTNNQWCQFWTVQSGAMPRKSCPSRVASTPIILLNPSSVPKSTKKWCWAFTKGTRHPCRARHPPFIGYALLPTQQDSVGLSETLPITPGLQVSRTRTGASHDSALHGPKPRRAWQRCAGAPDSPWRTRHTRQDQVRNR